MDNDLVQNNNNFGQRLQNIIDAKPYPNGQVDIFNLVKRTERISSALYLVTGFFPETDPLTQKLRSSAIELLSLMSHFVTESKRGVIGLSKDAHRIVIELVSFLETAKLVGFISDMNFNIISDEIEKVAHTLALIINTESGSSFLKKDFFHVPQSPKENKDGFSIGKVSQKNGEHKMLSPRKYQNPEKTANYMGISQKESSPGVVDMKRKSRREAILSLVKKHGQINIKDVSTVIKDCSEKTIQRELLGMVEEGVLKKQGERRWSIYSLAQTS